MNNETGKLVTTEEYEALPIEEKAKYRQLTKKEVRKIERELMLERRANDPNTKRQKEKQLEKRRIANKRNKQSRKNK